MNEPSPSAISQTAASPAPAERPARRGPGLLRRLWNAVLSAASLVTTGVANLFSFTALIAVTAWSIALIRGYSPTPAADKIISIGVVLLMLFEIWKTTSVSQLSKHAFDMDLATGLLELLVVALTFQYMLLERGWDFTLMMNWMMFIFAICDAFIVPRNRFTLAFRQIAQVTPDEHRHHHAQSAAAAVAHHDGGDS